MYKNWPDLRWRRVSSLATIPHLKNNNNGDRNVRRQKYFARRSVYFGTLNKREAWTAYLPHAIHIVDLPEVREAKAGMSLLDRIGCCEQTLERYKAAEWAHQQLLERREKVLGNEHPDTLASMNNLALALHGQAKSNQFQLQNTNC